MADLSKIKLNGTAYDLKDAVARTSLDNKVNYDDGPIILYISQKYDDGIYIIFDEDDNDYTISDLDNYLFDDSRNIIFTDDESNLILFISNITEEGVILSGIDEEKKTFNSLFQIKLYQKLAKNIIKEK